MSPLLRRRRPSDGIAVDGLTARRPHAGLLLEMYRRGGFRDDLLAERAAGIVGIDGRLAEIEALLHTGRRVPRCECGAPVLRGSRFCPNCGRPLGGPDETADEVSEETVI